MVRGVALLGAGLLAGCAATPSWNRVDKSMMGVNLACHAVDYAQTEWAMEHGFREVNPLLGDSPSDSDILTMKLATQALIYRLADGSENRAVTLALTLLPCLAVIGHNHAQGVRP